jgi:TRAP-type uncharacterized transport system fused permease subunit
VPQGEIVETIDPRKTQELEEKFDPEMRFRPLAPATHVVVGTLLIVLSCFHYYTAGFGLLRETTHRGIHLAFVLGLIFLVFPARKSLLEKKLPSTLLTPGGVSIVDWAFAVGIALSVLYIPWIFDDLAFRVGNPLPIDVAMGSMLIVLLLEATRRAMGWPLPVIAIVFMVYALAGPVFPGLLQHSGAAWPNLVNHLYLTSQGIYGIAVGVVATYVFTSCSSASSPRGSDWASSSSTSRRRSPAATRAGRPRSASSRPRCSGCCRGPRSPTR